MNKIIKRILVIVLIICGVIILDTLQARLFKTSPLISWKDNQPDSDSWVDKGILINTYYCTKESDIVTIYWEPKTKKFTCPIK